jgi:hypothetical protein
VIGEEMWVSGMTIPPMLMLLAMVVAGVEVVVWKKITPSSQIIVGEGRATPNEKNKSDVKLLAVPTKFPLILRFREYVACMLKNVKGQFSLTATGDTKPNTA